MASPKNTKINYFVLIELLILLLTSSVFSANSASSPSFKKTYTK